MSLLNLTYTVHESCICAVVAGGELEKKLRSVVMKYEYPLTCLQSLWMIYEWIPVAGLCVSLLPHDVHQPQISSWYLSIYPEFSIDHRGEKSTANISICWTNTLSSDITHKMHCEHLFFVSFLPPLFDFDYSCCSNHWNVRIITSTHYIMNPSDGSTECCALHVIRVFCSILDVPNIILLVAHHLAAGERCRRWENTSKIKSLLRSELKPAGRTLFQNYER